MASAIIHIAVANELNKTIKKDNKKLLIGSIAPDIAKQIGREKYTSHFSTEDNADIPNLNLFLEKYKNHMDDDFVLGYYIHLYTDYLWFKYFMTEIQDKNNLLTKLNGEIVKCDENTLTLYIYNDYTNLNKQVIDNYNLDLKIFYEELPQFDNIIKEVPMDRMQVLIDRMGIIVASSGNEKQILFNINHIETFIKLSTELILNNILEFQNN